MINYQPQLANRISEPSTGSIYGTRIFFPTCTINKKKPNPNVGQYTVRPMGWYGMGWSMCGIHLDLLSEATFLWGVQGLDVLGWLGWLGWLVGWLVGGLGWVVGCGWLWLVVVGWLVGCFHFGSIILESKNQQQTLNYVLCSAWSK